MPPGLLPPASEATRESPLLQLENHALLTQSAFFIPFRNLKQAWVSFGNEKPTPFGVGFLLDVVPPGNQHALSNIINHQPVIGLTAYHSYLFLLFSPFAKFEGVYIGKIE